MDGFAERLRWMGLLSVLGREPGLERRVRRLEESTQQVLLKNIVGYRGTSLVEKRRPLEPCSEDTPRALWWN